MKSLSVFLAPAFAFTLLAACSSSSGGGGGGADGGIHFIDSGTGGGVDGAPAADCPFDAQLTGLDPLPGSMAFDTAQPPAQQGGTPDPAVRYLSVGSQFGTNNLIFVELWDGYGVFSGGTYSDPPPYPRDFTIAGDEATLGNCGACVYMYANAQVANNMLTYDKLYVATAGTLSVTSAGTRADDMVTGQYTGSLSNVTFTEIDENSQDGGGLAGGCTTEIATATWDDTIQNGDQ